MDCQGETQARSGHMGTEFQLESQNRPWLDSVGDSW